MPSKSKTKGSSFEREVAKELSKLYNESFIRTPSSGAYVGGTNVVRKEYLSEGQVQSFRGDIIPPDDWKYFNVECKSYADFPFHQFLYQGNIRLLDNWIEQILEVAEEKDLNLLILKFNRKGKYIGFQKRLLDTSFYTHRHINYKDWTFTGYNDFLELNHGSIKYLSVEGIPQPLLS
jgi:Holliday junction resolvase